MPGRSLSRSLALLCFLILVTPASAFADHTLSFLNVPSTVQPNSSFTMTVKMTSSSLCSAGTVTMSANRSGVGFSPLSFSGGSNTSRDVVVTIGNLSAGSLTITAGWNAGGLGCSGTNSRSVTTTVAETAGTSTLVPGTTNAISAGTPRTVSIQLSKTSATPVTFTLTSSPAGAAQVPATVTVPANALSAPFTVTGDIQGDFTITATSTTSAFTSPAPIQLRTSGMMNIAPGTFCCVAAGGGTNNFQVGLVRTSPFGLITTNVPFTTGLAISGGAASGATLSVSTLNFNAGDTTKAVSLTSGPGIGDITLTFTNPGGNAYLSTTNTFIFKVQGKASVTNVAASMEVGQSTPITIQLSHPSIQTFSLNLTLNGNTAGASLSQTVVEFQAGEQSKTVTLTAGSTPSNNPLTIGGFVPGNAASRYFETVVAPATTIVRRTTAPTPVGTNVTVAPPNPDGSNSTVKVTFDEVTAAGQTKLLEATPIPAPSGYQVPGIPLFFALNTTATTTGGAEICASYAGATTGDETGLRLMKWNGTSWTDITTTVDTAGNVICGNGAPLDGSTFAIFGLNSAPIVGAITGPTAIVKAGETQQFSATFTDADAADVHTGTWVWGDGTQSPAVIENGTATGSHAFGAGTFQVRLVISDGGNNSASPDFAVTADGAAPVINTLTATPGVLALPANKKHDVALTVNASDDTGVPVCQVTGVTGAALNDKKAESAITGPMSVQLTAFPHSVYTITVTCTDAVGRTTTKSVSVATENGKK